MRGLLERYVATFDASRHVLNDPLQFPHRYADPADAEAVAFIAASMTFGRVAAFAPVLEGIFDRLGAHPAEALKAGGLAASTTRYRWLEARDIDALLAAVGSALRSHGSLQTLFAEGDRGEPTTWPALGRFLGCLKAEAAAHHDDPEARMRALGFLFPSTSGQAACKRQHLFLRWMARPTTEGADLALWPDLDPSRLVMPCDVHTARIGHALGLAIRPDSTRKTADELTVSLRAIDPRDPVRFDFAISHLGISDGCRGKRHEPVCSGCDLRTACVWWKRG
ncbi:MAG: TIGR02757 family protein [Proteobacteria bacterium]|nr:TIGR02757 family protein [Pseudomonadota bacterium]